MSDGIWNDWLPHARHAGHATLAGTDWLASAASASCDLRARWTAHPAAPAVLPCGTAFDVVNLPALFGRRVLEQLWTGGPGCGPVAVHRGRALLFAATGTADRLPALLAWEEWAPRVPRMLCYGLGDTVAVPPPGCGGGPLRWLLPPTVRHPWLPGPDVLLWACLRAVRPRNRLGRTS